MTKPSLKPVAQTGMNFTLAALAVLAAFRLDGAGEPPAVPDVDIRHDATVDVIARVMPSVVNIGIVGFSGDEGGGSGVVVDEEGYVLTNAHVVRGARSVWVKFNDNTEPIPAEPVALTRARDIALLRLKVASGRKFKAVKFAADDDLLLGETVIAIGNPFFLGGSVSRGILSSKNRRRPEELPSGEFLDIPDWLQTDAAINRGNSGGPLINLRGEMIGLNVAILNPGMAQGIGFAIPIKHVSAALAEILTGESIRGYWLGLRLKASGKPLVVQAVQISSPAEKAGFRTNDIIRSVNNRVPGSLIDFNRALLDAGDREDIRVTVERDGHERLLTLRMMQEKDFFNAELLRRRLGLTLDRLSVQQAYRMGLSGGFLITNVERAGPAAAADIQRGYILVAIDGEVPATIVDAAKAVHWKKRGDSVELGFVASEQHGLFLRRYAATAQVKLR
jgi:S1-C subfamily serine protease